jgi:hypothetical protein
MIDTVPLLHKPKWQRSGNYWQFVVGNKVIMVVIPNYDQALPHYRWISRFSPGPFPDCGWNNVDFADIEIAKETIEQWWEHMCRGTADKPE